MDQTKIGHDRYDVLLDRFIDEHRDHLHAVEINGLRDWKENQRTIDLDRQACLPLVSGGDRHGREPNVLLNLTNKTHMSEFIEEVRAGAGRILVIPQYRRPLPLRIIENFCDIAGDEPMHGLDWTRWSDRIFRYCDDGKVRTLAEMCAGREPLILRATTSIFRLLGSRRLHPVLEWAMPEPQELG